ncbi:hypothetical protein [Helicobacter saguini]|nr:hypothetical protein [Helicobacter saguini]
MYRIFLLLLFFTISLLDSKPVSVDEIFTQRQQFKILATISYANINQKQQGLSNIPTELPNGSGSIQIPVISSANINQDYLNFSFQFRYGVYKRVELFSALSAFWQNNIAFNNGATLTQSRGDFGVWNLGVLVQAKKEGKAPAIFVGASTDLLDRTRFSDTQSSVEYFKGFSIFATTFYTIDPIVLLLQGSFRFNLYKKMDNLSIDNAEIFSLSPMIYFAVNPYVSLNFGVKYQYKTKDYLNNAVVSPQGSSLSYIFGLAYEIKAKLIFFMDAEYKNTSEYTMASVNMSISYRI